MNRRKLLLASGVALSTAIAGCADETDETENGDADPNGNGDANGNEDDNGSDNGETDNGSSDDGNGDEDDEVERSDDGELLSITETLDADEPLFDPGYETFDGSGQTVTDEFSIGGALTTVVFEHDGESNFQVRLEGEAEESVVNEIGAVSGAMAAPTPGGDYLFDVGADGNWELHVGQPLAPDEEIRTVPVQASGEGPDVVGPLELEDAVTVAGGHSGESNFQVRIYDENDISGAGEGVFNEIGEFEGETRADYPGIVWVDVEADGEWTLEIE